MTTAPHPIRQPNLSIVKEPAEAAPAPVEGTVVEHQGELVRPGWVEAVAARATAAKDHAVGNKLYAGWSARGYRNLGRRWLDARRDDYPQMVQSAVDELRAAKGDTAAETAAKELVKERRDEYRRHKWIHLGKTAGWGAVGTAGAAVGAVTGRMWIDLAMAIAAYTTGIYHGRPDPDAIEIAAPSLSVIEQADGGFGHDAGQVFMTVDHLPEGGSPFPIAQARTSMQLAECVLRALVAEGVPVAEVSDVIRLS